MVGTNLRKFARRMKRNSDEAWEVYKMRRLADQVVIDHMLKGKLVWDSEKNGTFYKDARCDKAIRSNIQAARKRAAGTITTANPVDVSSPK